MKAGMINGILNNENNSVSSRIFFRNWMINDIRKNLLDAIEISDHDEVKINLERLEKKKRMALAMAATHGSLSSITTAGTIRRSSAPQ